MRTRLTLLAVIVAVAVVTGGCSSPSRSVGGADAPADTLRVGIEKPQSLDPAQARTPSELLIAEQLFDALTTYDPTTSAVLPAAAASWVASPDQRHWDFTLRPGAKFSNGREVTSEDVRYTLERITRKGSSSPAASPLSSISGFKAFNVDGKAPNLAGITTPSPQIVHFDLDEPQSSLPAILGNPSYGIVPKEAVEAQNPSFTLQPVGNGPFMMGSRNDTLLQLVPAPGMVMPLRAIHFQIFPDTGASYAAYQDGLLDWTAVPADRVEQVAEHNVESGRPYLGELFYGFNLKNPKFADVRFREAIVRAIDRDAIVRAIYGGSARRSDELVADGVPGFQAGACGVRCARDPQRSRDLLKEAFGDKPVPEVFIDFDDAGTQKAVAEAMQANLKDVGIPTTLRPHPFADYLKFAVSGQQEIFRLGWIGPYPTADAFLTPLFLSGLADNVTGFSSEPVDRLLKNGRIEGDEGKRIASYQEAEKLVLADLPVIPLAQFEFHSLSSDRVGGLVISGFGTFDASKVEVGRSKS
jgi:oligopeptide transport system substrate-binding protein